MRHMDWLADILKNLAVSKTLVLAIFITALVMYLGPIVAPSYVPKLQVEFIPYLFALVVLTGCLLVLWGATGMWGVFQRGIGVAARAFAGSTLSDAETALMFVLARDPTRPLNLEAID